VNPGGAPRASVAQAVRDSLTMNLTWFDASTAVITCASNCDNQAVTVELSTVVARFFGGIIGGDLNVSTHSLAVNGQITAPRRAPLPAPRGSWRTPVSPFSPADA
jgi:hypothetical protein